jgi:hypothetical protein
MDQAYSRQFTIVRESNVDLQNQLVVAVPESEDEDSPELTITRASAKGWNQKCARGSHCRAVRSADNYTARSSV